MRRPASEDHERLLRGAWLLDSVNVHLEPRVCGAANDQLQEYHRFAAFATCSCGVCRQLASQVSNRVWWEGRGLLLSSGEGSGQGQARISGLRRRLAFWRRMAGMV